MVEVRRPLVMQLPPSVLTLSEVFVAAGYELYVVGGAVRDTVLGLEPKDFDLATNATPEQVSKLIQTKLAEWTSDLTGEAFGVIRTRAPAEYWDKVRQRVREFSEVYGRHITSTFTYDHEQEHEIATFREDMTAGRHPVVRYATIVEDVNRRDLTINALFYDIRTGEVVDLVGGLHDLEFGVVKTVGDPDLRFAEDRLRVLRTLRFAARFGWPVGVLTERSILHTNHLDGISPERIRDEFVRSVQSAKTTSKLLELYSFFEMWERVLPDLRVSDYHAIATHDPVVLLSILLEGNDTPVVSRRLNELKYSDREVKQIVFLMQLRGLSVSNAYKLRKLADQCHITEEQINEWAVGRLNPAQALVRRFLGYRPTVKGDDLMAEGYSGKALGVELERRETELFGRL